MRDLVLIEGPTGDGARKLRAALFACDGVVWMGVVYMLATAL